MAKGFKIEGFEKVKENLNRELLKAENKTMSGLLEAAALIRTDMEKTPPLVPVDTGNLRASWFITPIKILRKVAVVLGFSANYAIYVHENMEAEFKRPGSGPKFFEAALKRNVKNIIKILQRNTKI